VELDVLMERQKLSHPDLLIPVAMKSIIDYIIQHGLDEVGVFRLAGNQIDIQTLKEKIDTGFLIPSSPHNNNNNNNNNGEASENNSPQIQEYNIHDIATLFKRFLRELPTPLLSFTIYHRFIAVSGWLQHR
jgi:myosin IX